MESTWGFSDKLGKLKAELRDAIESSNRWITELESESTHNTDDLAFLGSEYKSLIDHVLALQADLEAIEARVLSLELALQNTDEELGELSASFSTRKNGSVFPRSDIDDFRDFEGGFGDGDSGFVSPSGGDSGGSSHDSFLSEFRESHAGSGATPRPEFPDPETEFHEPHAGSGATPSPEFPDPETVVQGVQKTFSKQGWRASVEHLVKGSDIFGMLNMGAHGKQRETLRVIMGLRNENKNMHFSLRLMFLDNQFGPGSYAELSEPIHAGSPQMWHVSDVWEHEPILDNFEKWLQVSVSKQ